MKEILNIITPTYRLSGLGAVAASIIPLRELFLVRWFCVPNLDGHWGNLARNEALDGMKPEGWTYFLDDDNLVHPEFGIALAAGIVSNPSTDVFLFPQVHADGAFRIRRPTIHLGNVDSGCFVVRASGIGALRWEVDIYEADFHFLLAYCDQKGSSVKVLFMEDGRVFYNARGRREDNKTESCQPGVIE